MNFVVERDCIKIIPVTPQDRAYIEDTLGLRYDNPTIEARRVNVHGTFAIAYIELKKRRE